MDTTKPPVTCDKCGEPIQQGAPIDMQTGTDTETEQVVAIRLYHPACAPPLPA